MAWVHYVKQFEGSDDSGKINISIPRFIVQFQLQPCQELFFVHLSGKVRPEALSLAVQGTSCPVGNKDLLYWSFEE